MMLWSANNEGLQWLRHRVIAACHQGVSQWLGGLSRTRTSSVGSSTGSEQIVECPFVKLKHFMIVSWRRQGADGGFTSLLRLKRER